MKQKFINRYFESQEEYETYKPYLFIVQTAVVISLIFLLL